MGRKSVPVAHTILDGAIHTDSAAASVTRGSLIHGNSTPLWAELTIGDALDILGTDGTDAIWRSLSEAGIVAADGSVAMTGALDMGGSDIVNVEDLSMDSDGIARMESQNRFRYLQSTCRCRLDAVQAITTSTVTAISWDAGEEKFDTDGIHEPTTNPTRFTIALAGKYIVAASVSFEGNTTGVRITRIHVNGSTVGDLADVAVNGVNTTTAGGTMILDLAATDYVELMAFQNSGGDMDVRQDDTHLQIVYIGE